MCRGPSPYSPISDSDGSVLYTLEPEFLMFISEPVFQLIPYEILQKPGDSTLKHCAALPFKKSLTCSRKLEYYRNMSQLSPWDIRNLKTSYRLYLGCFFFLDKVRELTSNQTSEKTRNVNEALCGPIYPLC